MRVIFSFALLFSMLSIKAQTYNIDQLIGGKWICIKADCDTIYMELTAKYAKHEHITCDYSTGVGSQMYYLSQTIPAKFDFTKVGTNSSGKYIVLKGTSDNASAIEIKALSKDSLTLYEDLNVADEANREMFCYERYKRIK